MCIRDSPNTGFRGIRTKEFKLAYERKGKKLIGYFFDLEKDPFELNNLYQQDNSRVIFMKKQLIRLLKETNDPFVMD